MNCNDIQQCLIDESLPRPEGLSLHVTSCEACGPFSKSLQASRALRGVVPVQVRRVPVAKAKRRLQITAAIALVVSGVDVELKIRQHAYHEKSMPMMPHQMMVGPEQHSQPVVLTEAENAAAWRALGLLARGAAADARRNPRVHDPAYETFGALSEWIAPRRTYPIRSLELSEADNPLIHTSEDEDP